MSKNRETKPRLISFRVTEAEYQEIEKGAVGNDEPVNDWCQKQVLSSLSGEINFSRNEAANFEEIGCTRMLITHGFMMLAKNELTPDEWKEILKLTTKFSRKIGQVSLEKLLKSWSAKGKDES